MNREKAKQTSHEAIAAAMRNSEVINLHFLQEIVTDSSNGPTLLENLNQQIAARGIRLTKGDVEQFLAKYGKSVPDTGKTSLSSWTMSSSSEQKTPQDQLDAWLEKIGVSEQDKLRAQRRGVDLKAQLQFLLAMRDVNNVEGLHALCLSYREKEFASYDSRQSDEAWTKQPIYSGAQLNDTKIAGIQSGLVHARNLPRLTINGWSPFGEGGFRTKVAQLHQAPPKR